MRSVWDDRGEKWNFSVVDVCGVLADSKDYQTARKYWNKLKQRLIEEENETVTVCNSSKIRAVINNNDNSIPSEKAFEVLQLVA